MSRNIKLRWLVLLSLLTALFLITIPVHADDLQDGIDAFEKKDYKTAFEKFKPLAEQGNSEAQYLFGITHYWYRPYKDLKTNTSEERKWIGLSAKNGFAKAQVSLGLHYYRKFMSDKAHHEHLIEFIKWHRKAAEQGNAVAQYDLGVLYSRGEHVLQDMDEAKILFPKAAKQGRRDAQFEIGNIYSLGMGVPEDLDEARNWFLKAAKNRKPIGLTKCPGSRSAQFQLGLMNMYGVSVPQNKEKAFNWFSLASSCGHPTAQLYLVVMYAHGIGTKQDKDEALKWLRKAAEESKAPVAQLFLAECYSFIQPTNTLVSCPTDEELSAFWYRRSAVKREYMTRRDQIDKGEKLAKEWMEKHQKELLRN